MSSFKDMMAADIRNVILNTDEFAELRTIRYNGEEYADIPVIISGPEETDREQERNDYGRAVHLSSIVLHCAEEDLGNQLPEHTKTLSMNVAEGSDFFVDYRIVVSLREAGMLHLELERMK